VLNCRLSDKQWIGRNAEGSRCGFILVTERRRKRRKQPLDDVNEKRDTGNLKRKHYPARYGEFALVKAKDPSKSGLRNEWEESRGVSVLKAIPAEQAAVHIIAAFGSSVFHLKHITWFTSISLFSVMYTEPAWRSRYSDSLRAGRSGDRIPVGARFSAPIQTSSEAHPASCTMGTGSFPGVKAAGAWCWPPTPI
jgi:hypothetical protein